MQIPATDVEGVSKTGKSLSEEWNGMEWQQL